MKEDELMPINDFYGETFVAFTDIAGFKLMMKAKKVIQALDFFYSSGYNAVNMEC